MAVISMLKDGISPSIINATNELVSDLEIAIQKAENKGIPFGLIIGILELVKIDAVNEIDNDIDN